MGARFEGCHQVCPDARGAATRRASSRRLLRGAAERLGVDGAGPVLQVHMPDVIQPLKALGRGGAARRRRFWDGLAECVPCSGLAKNVGVSNYGPTLLERCARAPGQARRAPRLQPDRTSTCSTGGRARSRPWPRATSSASACFAYYPLAMGLLTGKLTARAHAARQDGPARAGAAAVPRGRRPAACCATSRTRRATSLRAACARCCVALQEVAAQRWQDARHRSRSTGSCARAPSQSPVRESAHAGCATTRGRSAGGLGEADVAVLDAAADSLPFEFRGSGFQTADSKFVGYGFERWKLD